MTSLCSSISVCIYVQNNYLKSIIGREDNLQITYYWTLLVTIALPQLQLYINKTVINKWHAHILLFVVFERRTSVQRTEQFSSSRSSGVSCLASINNYLAVGHRISEVLVGLHVSIAVHLIEHFVVQGVKIKCSPSSYELCLPQPPWALPRELPLTLRPYGWGLPSGMRTANQQFNEPNMAPLLSSFHSTNGNSTYDLWHINATQQFGMAIAKPKKIAPLV